MALRRADAFPQVMKTNCTLANYNAWLDKGIAKYYSTYVRLVLACRVIRPCRRGGSCSRDGGAICCGHFSLSLALSLFPVSSAQARRRYFVTLTPEHRWPRARSPRTSTAWRPPRRSPSAPCTRTASRSTSRRTRGGSGGTRAQLLLPPPLHTPPPPPPPPSPPSSSSSSSRR
jgi:hypothetical protein